MLPQLSIATLSLKQPLRAAIQTAGLMKVQGVRFDARLELKPKELSESARRDLLYLLKELNLKLSAISFSLSHSFYEQENLDARVAAVREAMKLSSQLSVSHLCLKVGQIPEDQNSSQYRSLHETISDLAKYGNHVGVTLTIIPMGEPPERLKEFLDSVRTGPVAVDFDPATMVLNGINPAETLRLLHQYVKQFTVRDAVRDFSGGGQEVLLGRGEVVWDEVIATLGEISFNGWLNLQRNFSDHPRKEMEQGVHYLKNITGELGWR